MSRYASLARRVSAAREDGLARRLRVVEPDGPVTARVDGRNVVLFCTNDYLGLAGHPEVTSAYRGGGAGASRLISGDRPAHRALEDALSERYGRPATLFNSGYAANLALAGVLERGDIVASDAMNHASIIDGLRLSPAEKVILPHGRPEIPVGARMVIVEGLYSMDGDILDLPKYFGDHWLAVDEAHSVGCIGPEGLGASYMKGVVPDFVVGTLGKAYGVAGAFIIGPPELRELLVSFGRSFVYTTGMPEPVAHAARAALRLANQERREALAFNARRLRVSLFQLGVRTLGDAHIIPVLTGEHTMPVAAGLLERGFLVPGIRWPTVSRGAERLRITVSSEHTTDQLDALAEAIEAELRAVREQ